MEGRLARGLLFLVATCALGVGGCDALDRQLERRGRVEKAPRTKPMKLTTKEPGMAVSLDGDSLGQTPMILDASKIEWPVTFRVFFTEGQREFTFDEYALERVLVFEEGDVPSDISVRDEARAKKKRARKKRRSRTKVNNVKGSKNISPY